MEQIKIIAILVLAALSMIGATAITSFKIPSAYADANCDKADVKDNKAGNERGNVKECFANGLLEGPKEPVRDCDHKNSFKNNNDDGLAGCRERGK
jgi:hypothetical protein